MSNKIDKVTRSREWYKAHHDEHLARMKEQILCPECGVTVARGGLPKHRRSTKHIRNSTNEVVRLRNAVETLAQQEYCDEVMLNALRAKLGALEAQ